MKKNKIYDEAFEFLTIDILSSEEKKKSFINRYVDFLYIDSTYTKCFFYLSPQAVFLPAGGDKNWDVVLHANVQSTYSKDYLSWKNESSEIYIKIYKSVDSVSETIKDFLTHKVKTNPEINHSTQCVILVCEENENFKRLKEFFSNYPNVYSVLSLKSLKSAVLKGEQTK